MSNKLNLLLIPGHGKETIGKMSPNGQFKEWQFARHVVAGIMSKLKDNLNFNCINLVPEDEQRLLYNLLSDLKYINDNSISKIFINWIDHHTQYSPERTDPCPDYYGMYELRLESDPRESVGVEVTLSELDTALCFLYNYVEYEQKIEP